MSEIAQLFESALRQNRANLLRKAAMNTVAAMPLATTLRELLDSEAGDAVRELTLEEFTTALSEIPGASGEPRTARAPAPSAPPRSSDPEAPSSREEQLYRDILTALEPEALTIGQLSKKLGLDVDELRGYLVWMKKMGKVGSTGRARATRYHVAR
jgi:hypothetical protein